MMAALAPMVAVAVVAASTMAAMWGQASVSTTTPTATLLPDASHRASSLRETGRSAAATESVVNGGCGRRGPSPTASYNEVAYSHFFCPVKLCFVSDRLSGKDFLVDTGAALSLLPHQSDTAATEPKQPIKTWNFVNTRVEINDWEQKFVFLHADVPCPIIGLDFLRFFGMQVNPSSSEIFIPPPPSLALSGRWHWPKIL
jgi:predicted aspartyl protease